MAGVQHPPVALGAGELSKSGGLAVECQKARLGQVSLIPASADSARRSANWRTGRKR
jgi:hypothetical protein